MTFTPLPGCDLCETLGDARGEKELTVLCRRRGQGGASAHFEILLFGVTRRVLLGSLPIDPAGQVGRVGVVLACQPCEPHRPSAAGAADAYVEGDISPNSNNTVLTA